MNKQQIFDTAAAHLRKQGKQAINETGDCCQYRTPEGLKCAAGCLISDGNYRAALEGKILSDPMVAEALFKSGIDIRDVEIRRLVHGLQLIHDDMNMKPGNWQAALRGFAHAHGLSTRGL